ncbi:SusD/RagB family nutrient-binding outer membrane lipoprotein [Mucilaginibacter sp.]|uniref:SusD/RagB family nutrient-binding outer membrane lipoprotein n=1 Tax=Mucilaginibacter sp. TaxID=1882438 RepID=UPI00284D8883|nr:SusD/RagB family nutrient-binding outer membrane lipoprotein [Mucilaginibacter sp.]MDR3694123.1 SusD/RagB family nutrient-binding outer membrane lipoprotein [Mucilaginibacter sp.]
MKTITIFKRKVNIALLSAVVVLAGAAGCKKGTFDINGTNPNSPSTVLPKYSLSASLSGTANLMYSAIGTFNNGSTIPVGGNQDMINNWMGYWTQSGAYTPSNTYVLYQLTSSTASGNWDAAYNNLSNYHTLITSTSADATLVNYRAIAMMMTAFVYQRIVDLYNKAPYTGALVANSTFSYKYDDGATIYKACIAKIDSAVALIKANPGATSPGGYDVMFGGDMSMWVKFGNTLKLKMLMRQTASSANGSLGDAGVAAALLNNPGNSGKPYTAADFLGAGEDATVNPGYSSAADNQENPLFIDVVTTSTNNPGYNEKYFRANAYGVSFYQNHNDPRLAMLYLPNNAGVIQGRVYGSTLGTEANSVISGLTGYGANASAKEGAPIIPAFESLFLVAEAQQRGYIKTGSAAASYKAGVEESFRILGSDAATADTYMAQNDAVANFTLASDPITAIITQKWAACNSLDPLESFSDWRRLNIPATLPVSKYPGVTVTHIPYRLPYPTSELSYNSANVPDGGTGTEALSMGVFWMPNISR